MSTASEAGPVPLHGVRVIDLSNGVAGAYGAKMLAAWGADVIKVEPPEGDPTRHRLPRVGDSADGSILFGYLNTGKRSVAVDPLTREGIEALTALVAPADVVIESHAPGWWARRGLDLAAARKANPALIVCSVTPYGQDGPQAGWLSTPLTAFAAGGQMMVTGDEDKPPMKTAGYQADYQAGLHVFSSVATALVAVKRGEPGDHLDISMQEVQNACLEGFGPAAMVRGSDASRAGNQLRAIWGMYACADGWVGVSAMARQTGAVYACIGRPELADDPAFLNLLLNPEMNEVVQVLIGEWAAERTAAEIFAEAGRQRAPFSLVATPEDLLENAQLKHQGFWQTLEHPVLGEHKVPGMPFTLDDVLPVQSRAPLLGEHTGELLGPTHGGDSREEVPVSGQRKPLLDGVRVLDFSQVWAGPYAARFMADMGADVIHIEGPNFADAVRGVGRSEEPRGFDQSAYFNEYNRNKRGMALAMDKPEGHEAFLRLLAKSDIVLENWSVGVADRLGVSWDVIREANPRAIFIQMPAFGQTGPEANRVGFGPGIEQMGGLVALQGYEGEGPHRSGISYGDPNAGIVAAGAAAIGLLHRENTGEGCHIVLRQRDNLTGMVGEYMVAASIGIDIPRQMGNRDLQMAPHGVYRCLDDSGRYQADVAGNIVRELTDTWVAIACEDDEQWERLKGLIGDPRLNRADYDTLAGRKADEGTLDQVVGEWTATREAEAAADELQAAGVAATPVLSPLMLLGNRQMVARQAFTSYDHPIAGTQISTRPVWRLQDRLFRTVGPAPCFGEHNREVLRELGDYSDSEIDALEAAGVITDEPTA
ncbi:MAG: CoA transferase [Dehalococcoidia bacterium]|nr:CoA transferase [Dehalococcoidia bacterium]